MPRAAARGQKGTLLRVGRSQVRLPARFSTAELGGGYVLPASLPRLEAQSVRTPQKGGGGLSIQGASAAERRGATWRVCRGASAAFEQLLAAHLESLPREQRRRLRQEEVVQSIGRISE